MTYSTDYLASVERSYNGALATLPKADIDAFLLLTQRVKRANSENIVRELRELKALFGYRWAIARIQNGISDVDLGRYQTEFAEATIDRALQAAWCDTSIRRTLLEPYRNNAERVPGLFVLGLGKLCGFDLNFSSDIDVVAFYDVDRLPMASGFGRMDVCVKVLKEMTRILGVSEQGEFVWRVDWRLRPDASVNPLVISTSAANEFYHFRSLPWHRLAMIKARPVGGDLASGNEFLAGLTPYLWRQNLDYQMVDEVYRLKEKINLEHPQLRETRLLGEEAEASISGFNLKLGAGGIREIEFIANAMQLLWGGKKTSLRHTNTLAVLRELATLELISEDWFLQLSSAYSFFRRLEDGIQIRENLQVHCLPKNDDDIHELAVLLGLRDGGVLEQDVLQHRQYVSQIFSEIFTDAPIESKREGNKAFDKEATPAWTEQLTDRPLSVWRSWEAGFMIYGVSASQAAATQPLLGKIGVLLGELIESERNSALIKFDDFFRSIPTGSQYFRLLTEHPKLLEDIFYPLTQSPPMADLLDQSPYIVDCLLEEEVTDTTTLSFEHLSRFVVQDSRLEVRHERLRRFVNEQLYKIYLAVLRGEKATCHAQVELTQLAEHSIQLGLTIVVEAMGLDHSPIAVLGMGKLGMGVMAPTSDLDLIFVAEDAADMVLATNFSRRFQTLMATRTREGRVYEMDMRLRPSGRSGPITTRLSSFREYQLTRARTWEHIALVSSRPLSGNAQVLAGLAEFRAEILGRQRDTKQFQMDAMKMLRRLRQQRLGKSDHLGIDVKLRSGGLMELEYLSACQCLTAPVKNSDVTNEQLIAACWQDGQREQYITVLSFWRRLQVWSRLLGLGANPVERIPKPLLQNMFNDLDVETLGQLEARIGASSDWVLSEADAQFPELKTQTRDSDWEDWIERPVSWSK